MEPLAKIPEVIDLEDDEDDVNEADTVEMLEMVTSMVMATDAVPSGEPLPEPSTATKELLNLMRKIDDAEDEGDIQATEDTQLLAEAYQPVVQDAVTNASDILSSDQPGVEEAVPSEAVVDEVVVVMEDGDGPSWLEKKLGPWVARHRSGLRASLILLLAVYVAIFASMIFQSGLRGLSERTPAATVRDLLWAVLMGLIVLLAIGKHY